MDQKSPRPPKEGVLRWHTQTDRQTDIATSRLNRPKVSNSFFLLFIIVDVIIVVAVDVFVVVVVVIIIVTMSITFRK